GVGTAYGVGTGAANGTGAATGTAHPTGTAQPHWACEVSPVASSSSSLASSGCATHPAAKIPTADTASHAVIFWRAFILGPPRRSPLRAEPRGAPVRLGPIQPLRPRR